MSILRHRLVGKRCMKVTHLKGSRGGGRVGLLIGVGVGDEH